MATPTDRRFVLTLRTTPETRYPICALRKALKMMLRYCGLRCESIREITSTDEEEESTGGAADFTEDGT